MFRGLDSASQEGQIQQPRFCSSDVLDSPGSLKDFIDDSASDKSSFAIPEQPSPSTDNEDLSSTSRFTPEERLSSEAGNLYRLLANIHKALVLLQSIAHRTTTKEPRQVYLFGIEVEAGGQTEWTGEEEVQRTDDSLLYDFWDERKGRDTCLKKSGIRSLKCHVFEILDYDFEKTTYKVQ
ncbi:hypothetical protein PG994_015262 [Apiospora phragmitis]|uniref:Uncharacterized protein n=1 Tax=Apiospora phragmitis TaxID=2905665 RepID=A0ABR1SR08_9PEZI